VKRSLIIDPRSEDPTNAPLEIWTEPGHGPGIYVTDHKYPDPEQEILSAGGREGKRRSGPPMMGNRQIPLEVFLMGRREDLGTDAVNLLANPSFERDLSGWEFAQDSFAEPLFAREPNPGFAPQGEYSARLYGVKDNTATTRHVTLRQSVAIVAGTTYALSAYTRCVDPGIRPERNLSFEFVWQNAKFEAIGEDEDFWSLAAGFEGRLSHIAKAPAGASFVTVVLNISSATALDKIDYWFDDCMLEAAAAPSLYYFDGDTPGCGWDGTPGLSASRQPANGDDHFEAMVRDLEGAWSKIRDKGGTYSRPYRDGRLIFDLEGLAAGDPGNYEGRRWVQRGQKFSTTLEALPYGRGEKQTRTLRSQTTDPVLVFEESLIPGSVRALGELEITDTAAQTRRGLVAGIELPDYDPTAATAKLYYQAEALTPLGSSTLAESVGAVGAGKNVVRATLESSRRELLSTKLVAGSAHLTHVGTFRVFARVKTEQARPNDLYFWLSWGQGDLVERVVNDPFELASSNTIDYWIIDLGIIRISKATVGKQRWEGRIIGAIGEGQQVMEVSIDDVRLVPVGAAALRATRSVTTPGPPTTFARLDHFEQQSLPSPPLNGKSANIGGVWATSGGTGDFENDGSKRLVRKDEYSAKRLALLPGSISGAVAMRITVGEYEFWTGGTRSQGILVRYIDANNYVTLKRVYDGVSKIQWMLNVVVAGVKYELVGSVPEGALDIAIFVSASGYWAAYATSNIGGPLGEPIAHGFHSALVTGGALAAGQIGLWDERVGPSSWMGMVRYFDELQVWVPADPALISPGRRLRWRHDGVQREDAAGGELWSPVGYEGDPLLIPPSTKAQDVMRAIVFPTRGDLDVLPDSGASDDFTAQLALTSRHVSVR
jgi:hypothetical protein